jgi:hypothetical protein
MNRDCILSNPFKDTKQDLNPDCQGRIEKEFTTRLNARADEAEALWRRKLAATPAQMKRMLKKWPGSSNAR